MRNCRRLWSSYRVLPKRSIELEAAIAILWSARACSDGLGDDADVVDARLAERIHYRGKAPEGNGLIAAQEYTILLVLQFRMDSGSQLVNVDRLVPEIDAL